MHKTRGFGIIFPKENELNKTVKTKTNNNTQTKTDDSSHTNSVVPTHAIAKVVSFDPQVYTIVRYHNPQEQRISFPSNPLSTRTHPKKSHLSSQFIIFIIYLVILLSKILIILVCSPKKIIISLD